MRASFFLGTDAVSGITAGSRKKRACIGTGFHSESPAEKENN